MRTSNAGGHGEPSRRSDRDEPPHRASGYAEPGQELNLDVHSGPGQRLNTDRATTPRQAATVILLRGGDVSLELLLVKRTESARFMGGVWVFPGGAVDDGDPPSQAASGLGAHRAAAVRELREEAAVTIDDPSTLVEFSRWITPAQVTVRYDTRFFLARLPDGQEPEVDGQECVAQGWFTPQGALDAHDRGDIVLVFPTIKHLQQLSAFSTVAELLRYASSREVLPIEPKVVLEGEVARVLLPGEPGYE